MSTPLEPSVSTRAPVPAPRVARTPAVARSLAGGLPRPVRLALLAAGVALLVCFFAGVVERLVFRDKVLPGVDIPGVRVERAAELEAYARISELAVRLESEPIEARAGDVALRAAPSDLGVEVDEYATLRAAREAGRSGNPVEQTLGTVLRRFRHDEVALRVEYDDAALDRVLDVWQAQTTSGTVEGGLRFEGARVIPMEPEAGVGLQREPARQAMEHYLRGDESGPLDLPVGKVDPVITMREVERVAAHAERVLEQPVEIVADATTLRLTPEQVAGTLTTSIEGAALVLSVDTERLRAALGEPLATLGTPPADATFQVLEDGSVQVAPSQAGREVDLQAVGAAILQRQRRITAPLRPVEPEHDTAWAQGLGIKELVSTFTTRHPSGQERVKNIHRAADLIDDVIVEPGEVFSLNEAVGPRTAERGFVKAPVYYGEFTEDYGGGVSQLATTVFNAVFFGGYEDVYHKPHTIYFSRYPMGREATVNFPSLDLQFRNDSSAGILIRTSYSDTSITVSFYGDKEGKVVTADGPNVLAERPIVDEYVDWPLLPVGETKRIEEGHTGYDVEVFRVIERPGEEPTRERFFWRYKMLPNKILRGTATPTTTTTVPPSTVPGSPTTAPKPPAPPTTPAP